MLVVAVVLLVVAVLAALIWYGDVVQKREQARPADLVIDEQVIDRIMGELEARMGEHFGAELEGVVSRLLVDASGADTESVPVQAGHAGGVPALRWDEAMNAWTDGERWYRAAQ